MSRRVSSAGPHRKTRSYQNLSYPSTENPNPAIPLSTALLRQLYAPIAEQTYGVTDTCEPKETEAHHKFRYGLYGDIPLGPDSRYLDRHAHCKNTPPQIHARLIASRPLTPTEAAVKQGQSTTKPRAASAGTRRCASPLVGNTGKAIQLKQIVKYYNGEGHIHTF